MLLSFLVVCTINMNGLPANDLPFIWQRGATYLSVMGEKDNSMYQHVALEAEFDNEKATEYWSSDTIQPNKDYKIKTTFDAKSHTTKMWINGKAQTLHIIYPQPTSANWRPYLDHPFIVGSREGHTDRDFNGTIKINRVVPSSYGKPIE